MSANQVVLYFDKQEDALLFTVAASSVMSAEGPVHRSDAVVKGCGRDLQSQSNHGRGRSEHHVKDGTHKMIRKALLQIGAPALLAFMAWNAYLAVNHLKQMQHIAARTLESSTIQADISTVLKDLTDMETGQRGYLLTGDSSYLQPYTDAKGRIGSRSCRPSCRAR